MNIKEIKKISEKYEFGNLNNSKGMKTSVEMMYHSTVKIQKYLKIFYNNLFNFDKFCNTSRINL